MLDPAFLRDNMDAVRAALARRGVDLTAELETLSALEAERRRLLPLVEELQREQNAAAEEVARARREGRDTGAVQTTNRARAQEIKRLGAELETIEQQRHRALLGIPNLPHDSVPTGKSSATKRRQEAQFHFVSALKYLINFLDTRWPAPCSPER